jgi:hypothetical protein
MAQEQNEALDCEHEKLSKSCERHGLVLCLRMKRKKTGLKSYVYSLFEHI